MREARGERRDKRDKRGETENGDMATSKWI